MDDSRFFLEALSRGLSADPAIEVVATARDFDEVWAKIAEVAPDLLTYGVGSGGYGEDGVAFIRCLSARYPIPVVTVGPRDSSAAEALRAGAIDFIAKPAGMGQCLEACIHELIETVKEVARMRSRGPAIVRAGAAPITNPVAAGADAWPKLSSERPRSRNGDRIVVIGASAGGTEAIHFLLQDLPADHPGIVVVQPLDPVYARMFAERLNQTCAMTVREAGHGDYVRSGTVLVAPGDRHVAIVGASGGRFRTEFRGGEPVNGHCPSVDVLFESAAQAAGPRAIGIVLTGTGRDGAEGLLAMRRQGARTIGQDELSSVVCDMPNAAFDIGAVEFRAPLTEISGLLRKLILDVDGRDKTLGNRKS